MIAIENGEKEIEEIEMFESDMPGSCGLSLMAKATRTTQIRGGVIADAIGAGKTVISIAIIIKGLAQGRAARKAPRKSGATLVVVPPALIDQWASEIAKFTKASDKVNVLRIYDQQALQKTTLRSVIDADSIIIPVDILESDGYLANLLRHAKLQSSTKNVPKLPTYSGQTEQNAARGVWIPASSTEPYGGGNNPKNQQRRDHSASYTHVYHQAIAGVREQTFKQEQKGVPLEYFEFERNLRGRR